MDRVVIALGVGVVLLLSRGARAEPNARSGVIQAANPVMQGPPPFQPFSEWRWRLGLPFSFGHGVYSTDRGDSNGLWFGLRAQALVERVRVLEEPPYQEPRLHYDWGFGLYADVSRHPILGKKRTAWGAGLIGLRRLKKNLLLMPSLGLYRQDFDDGKNLGVAASLFVGALADTWEPLGLPFGVRVDFRYGLGNHHERTFLVGGQLDATFGVLAPVAMVMLIANPPGRPFR